MAEGARPLLEGLRVLDLSIFVSGPYAMLLLADLGADVLKVESPSGDPQRTFSPRKEDIGLMWSALNRNKRSIGVDLKTVAGREVVLKLLRGVDVIFNNFRPGVMARLGLSFEAVKAVNPTIVYASLSGYGATGPRAAEPSYDIAVQAMSGGMSLTGYAGGPPVRSGIPIGDVGGGLMAAMAIVAALYNRRERAEAIQLDLSLMDTQISLLMYWAGYYLNAGIIPGKQGSGNQEVTPYGAMTTADGYIVVAPYGSHFWPVLCRCVGLGHIIDDERFLDNDARVAHRSELEALFHSAFSKKTTAEWESDLRTAGIPCSRVNDVGQALDEPQVRARQMRLQVDLDGSPWEFAGNPIKTNPPTPTPTSPPARLGEHTRRVLCDELALEKDEVDRLFADGVVFESDAYHL